MKKLTTEEFIRRATEIHGGMYDYSLVDYVNARTKIAIRCRAHGSFFQLPHNHLKGRGCPKCGKEKGNRARAFTPTEFINKSRKIHGDLYGYDRIAYRNARTKVEIVCREHGSFWQLPGGHLKGRGCPKCGKEKGNRARTLTLAEFINKARKIHGDLYGYRKTIYRNSYEKIEIVCREHGSFWQKPSNHLNGNGCPECAGNLNGSTNEFINRAKETHGDLYIYDKVVYRNAHEKVEIICRKHGSFWQKPGGHLKGHGCPECVNISKRLTTAEFINKARKVHGDLYGYDKVVYKRSQDKIEILCPIHGSFFQAPNSHLQGQGCPECSAKNVTTEKFINKARKVHGHKYNYSQTVYRKSQEKIEILCPKHGSFPQAPDSHLQGNGCPKCSNSGPSKAETELADFLESHFEIERNNRTILNGKELDIYIPDKQIAVEYNGNFWHSEKYRDRNHLLDKKLACEEKGIRLIHVAEYEDINVVKKTLLHILGVSHSNRLFARKCTCKMIDPHESKDLLDNNHLQGWIQGCLHAGLFYGDELVGVMLFSHPTSRRGFKKKEGVWELRRFALTRPVIGGASKLFSFFRKTHKVEEVISYSDRRWFDGKVYEKMGFVNDGAIRPDYKYVHDNRIFNKNRLMKSRMAKMDGFNYDPALTEHENALNNGFYRLFDCGKIRWVWRKENPGL